MTAPMAAAVDQFGIALALSADGATLAVGADGVGASAGAAYMFSRDGVGWRERALVQASNAEANDAFGFIVAVSGDGRTLAVGAKGEASGRADDPGDNSTVGAGATYVFE